MKNKENGFSLIELLIVVAIILIIASIAIPNLLRAKMAANEASAVASLRVLNTTVVEYSTTYGSDPAGLADLKPATTPSSTAADLVDNILGADPAVKSGYSIAYTGGPASAWSYRHLHNGCDSPILFDRPAEILHGSERRDSRDHGRFNTDRQQYSDRIVIPGSDLHAGEGQALLPHFSSECGRQIQSEIETQTGKANNRESSSSEHGHC